MSVSESAQLENATIQAHAFQIAHLRLAEERLNVVDIPLGRLIET